MKPVDEYSDQEKIDFFNVNWEYIDRILTVLQSGKIGDIRAGENMLKWIAEYLERKA
jgi:hypothetical protein